MKMMMMMVLLGATVLTVIATDSDSGNNGSLVYSLANVPRHNGLPMFAVDPNNGLITTVQSNVLDRELTSEYQLTVVATDRGRPRLSGAFYHVYLLTSNLFVVFVLVTDRISDTATVSAPKLRQKSVSARFWFWLTEFRPSYGYGRNQHRVTAACRKCSTSVTFRPRQ